MIQHDENQNDGVSPYQAAIYRTSMLYEHYALTTPLDVSAPIRETAVAMFSELYAVRGSYLSDNAAMFAAIVCLQLATKLHHLRGSYVTPACKVSLDADRTVLLATTYGAFTHTVVAEMEKYIISVLESTATPKNAYVNRPPGVSRCVTPSQPTVQHCDIIIPSATYTDAYTHPYTRTQSPECVNTHTYINTAVVSPSPSNHVIGHHQNVPRNFPGKVPDFFDDTPQEISENVPSSTSSYDAVTPSHSAVQHRDVYMSPNMRTNAYIHSNTCTHEYIHAAPETFQDRSAESSENVPGSPSTSSYDAGAFSPRPSNASFAFGNQNSDADIVLQNFPQNDFVLQNVPQNFPQYLPVPEMDCTDLIMETPLSVFQDLITVLYT